MLGNLESVLIKAAWIWCWFKKSLSVPVPVISCFFTVFAGLGFSSSSQWDLMGTAMVTPDHVRLTPDLQSRQGAVWSRIVSVHQMHPTHGASLHQPVL